MKTDPLLLDVPDRLETPRLILRVPRAGDGAITAASVRESLPQLKPWMPWAKDDYSDKDGEEWCRRSAAGFIQRSEIQYTMWLASGEHIGSIGAIRFDWDVPRGEIGYWLRTSEWGHGYMREAVETLTCMLLDRLQFVRVELRMDDLNTRSWRVAERCGYIHEGTLRSDFRYPDGRLRNTRIYSRVTSA